MNELQRCFENSPGYTRSVREGLKKTEESVTFSPLRGVGWGAGGGGRRSTSLGDFVAAQKHFVCLQEAPKQTLCSLLTSDMLDIASNSLVKTSCTYFSTPVADRRQW